MLFTPSRVNTGSYKWDSRPDTLPLWVADMDFKTAQCIIDALEKRVAHGIFGYTLVTDSYYQALINWFSTRHGYDFTKEQVIYTTGVVPAISAIIKALVRKGDGVIVQTPVYNCFFSSIKNNECRVVENPLLRIDLPDGKFTYEMDFVQLEKIAKDPSNTMLLLCNPHNPAGRLWRRDELEKLSKICKENNVVVVSDEIHCELTAPDTKYIPFGTIDASAVICVSPSKAFNIAGLQIANIITPSEKIRNSVDRAININEVCDVNPFGVEALKAAYTEEGEKWLTEIREKIWSNYDYLYQFMRKHLPQCPIALLEATYLPWIDISCFEKSADTLETELLEKAGVWLNSGTMYGRDGYLRINIACSRELLSEALNRIITVLT